MQLEYIRADEIANRIDDDTFIYLVTPFGTPENRTKFRITYRALTEAARSIPSDTHIPAAFCETGENLYIYSYHCWTPPLTFPENLTDWQDSKDRAANQLNQIHNLLNNEKPNTTTHEQYIQLEQKVLTDWKNNPDLLNASFEQLKDYVKDLMREHINNLLRTR